MDYGHIKGFLDKFKKILSQKEVSSRIIAETITKHISFEIKQDLINIKNGIIFINSSPSIKNEILIHKQGIISDLNKFLPQSHFKDIK